MFAKWWSLRPEANKFGRAINARFIMNNNLSHINDQTPATELPYMIWYPTWANKATYKELARRKPTMLPAVAHACIVADFQDLWDSLDIVPDEQLFAEARASPNPHYADLQRRCAERGLEHLETELSSSWVRYFTRKYPMEPSIPDLRPTISAEDVGWDQDGPFDGCGANMGMVELFACVPEMNRPSADYHFLNLAQLYEEMSRPPQSRDHYSRAYLLRARA